MNKELKITIIATISGAIAGIAVSLISGYFEYTTKQSELSFKRENITNERAYNHKKELRELIAKYNVATNILYAKIRADEVGETLENLLRIKNTIEEIKLMGNIEITDEINRHSISLLDYFNKFRAHEGENLHEIYIKRSAYWAIITRMKFEETK